MLQTERESRCQQEEQRGDEEVKMDVLLDNTKPQRRPGNHSCLSSSDVKSFGPLHPEDARSSGLNTRLGTKCILIPSALCNSYHLLCRGPASVSAPSGPGCSAARWKTKSKSDTVGERNCEGELTGTV